MAADTIEAIETLLARAEKAHGAYEATELDGVYDREWPRWYAAYAVENGIGELIGHPVMTDELAEFLANSYADFERTEPKPGEPWAAYIARRVVAEL